MGARTAFRSDHWSGRPQVGAPPLMRAPTTWRGHDSPCIRNTQSPRRSVARLLLCAIAGGLIPACGGPAEPSLDEPGDTFLRFESDPGDFVGQGRTHYSAWADGTWFVHTEGAANALEINQISFFVRDPIGAWYLDFAAISGQRLAVGTYENAQRFNSLSRPNLDFGWQGRGCNEVVGRFVVLQLETTERILSRVHATFEQHCEGAPAALRGEISYVK